MHKNWWVVLDTGGVDRPLFSDSIYIAVNVSSI